MPSVAEVRTVPWHASLERSPWILGHVSRHWRAVALASPTLWSRISIIRSTSSDDSEICSFPMLETQLARSGKAPLEVIFDYEKLNDESDGDVPELALQTLARHSARWKALYITGSQCAHLASVRGGCRSWRSFQCVGERTVLEANPEISERCWFCLRNGYEGRTRRRM